MRSGGGGASAQMLKKIVFIDREDFKALCLRLLYLLV